MDMKLGLQSAILADYSFEEVMAFAGKQGFACVELMSWPKGGAERRYAGVTHVDANALDEATIAHIHQTAKDHKVEISGLGYYPNPMDPDLEKRAIYIEHLKKVITAAGKLGLEVVNTFIGRDPAKSVDESFEMFKEIWPPIIKHAEACNVKIAIENCPMLFTMDEWPGGKNLATTPAIWRRMFEEIPSDYFGLNYDPSHLLWMQMDYIAPIYEFGHKFFHVHIKDAKVFKDKLDEVGIMA
ncbi:MAG: sugar phosphate isomerase/epimerase, partial [Oscillospiraceae bacterium]|nr:sugar phosphate isomerase/epimerase [Oscillospiraceae bacterium]